MNTIPKNINSTLTPHQKIVFSGIVSQIEGKLNNILKSYDINDYQISLSGAAGTGKTYLTSQIVKYFQNKLIKTENYKYRVTVTAPTNKAVGVLSSILKENGVYVACKTIHSFLGIKQFRDYTTGEEKFIIDKTQKKLDTTSILIVDESSMVSSKLHEYILEAIEANRVNIVLFIGDPYQLLPVDNSKNTIFNLPQNFVLDEVVRQAKDSYIIKIATKLRNRIQRAEFIPLKQFIYENLEPQMKLFHNEKDFIDDFYERGDLKEEKNIIATYKNKDVDAFNKIIRDRYWRDNGISNPQTLIPGDMIRFKDTYSVRDITIYHNGQVIEIEETTLKYHEALKIEYWECREKNNYKQQTFRVVDPKSMSVFNEKLNTIASMAKRSKYYPEKNNLWKAFYDTRDMFANVQYIHAGTIHKLQGSTYEISYVDAFSLANNQHLSEDEKYRLFYVAITRASKDIKIFISALNKNEQKELEEFNIADRHNETDSLLKDILDKI